jgi:hypothetical protein
LDGLKGQVQREEHDANSENGLLRGTTLVDRKKFLYINQTTIKTSCMKRFIIFLTAVCLWGGWLTPPVCGVQSTNSSAQASPPGTELAKAVSTVTGVAISPLLGASAVGAWKYAHTETPEAREKLPWYAQPWFWVPAFILLSH